MNRMFIAFFVAAIYCTSAAAQTPVAAKPMEKSDAPKVGTTKVAVFNAAIVFGKYERAAAMKEEMAQGMKRLQAEGKELADNLNAWQAAVQKGDIDPAKKERLEEKIIIARRRLEDLGREARAKVGKSQDASLRILWTDIRAAVKAYAAEHDIDLVIAYGDPKEADQIDKSPNINRKMANLDQGGAFPFFMAPGVDISEGIVEQLNRHYREQKADPAEDDPR